MEKSNEEKIYELLGIKYFKNFVLSLYQIIIKLMTKGLEKEEIKSEEERQNNYKIGKIKSIEDIIKFKKSILFNSTIHVIGTTINIIFLLNNDQSFLNYTCLILNAYCVMLQRYNYIKLKRVIKKLKPAYEEEKEKLSNQLIEEDKILKKHKYSIINSKGKSKEKTIETIIKESSLQELKDLKEYLIYFNNLKHSFDQNNLEHIESNLPYKNNKTLKLELTK